MSGNDQVVVASFDVGVKNLAFCILRYDSTAEIGQQFPIMPGGWRCVDVTDDSGIGDRLCEGKKKDGSACPNGAKILTDDDEAYCGVHNPDKERYKAKPAAKVKNLSYERLGNAFLQELDQHEELWNQVDHVIIEQQFRSNRRMIFLSAIIFTYFIGRQRDRECRISRVKFASSRNKLQVYSDCGGPAITERPRKGAKDHRKWLAPKHCEWLIRGDQANLDAFRRYPRKKDDLADCFLQGADYHFNECRAVKRPSRKKTATKKKRVTKKTIKK
jgi:hypothetical protein